MVSFPKLSSDTLVPLFQPKSRDFMVIFLKLSSHTPVPLFQPISRYYMVSFPNLSSDTLVPLFQPKSSNWSGTSLSYVEQQKPLSVSRGCVNTVLVPACLEIIRTAGHISKRACDFYGQKRLFILESCSNPF